jgi:acetolactate synthase-1/2/3 large subunit
MLASLQWLFNNLKRRYEARSLAGDQFRPSKQERSSRLPGGGIDDPKQLVGRPAFVVEGDASFLMHLSEFETACRYQIPILVVVMNDEALGAEYHKARSKGLNPELAVIPTPELGPVAVALGGSGATVRTTTELAAALAEYAREPRPTVIDVRITRDVLSIPYRRLWYGENV